MSTQTNRNAPGRRGAGGEDESPATEMIEMLEDEIEEDEIEIEKEEFEWKKRMLESLKIRIESQSGVEILDEALSEALERIAAELGLEPDDCEASGVTPWSGIGFRHTFVTSCLGRLRDPSGRQYHVIIETAGGYVGSEVYAELTKVEFHPVEEDEEEDEEE